MSSMSAQGVVERASAELSKRINGLGLRGKHHSPGGARASVMERVTSALCGGSAALGAPDKPARQPPRRPAPNPTIIRKPRAPPPPGYLPWELLILDEKFLCKLFLYFTPSERRSLAQVCCKWRDVLYRPRWWSGLIPVLRCKELRVAPATVRARLYASLIRRGFRALSLMGATDEDAMELPTSFPLAAAHVHSLSLRCSSLSDRGLETLLDHLQVSQVQLQKETETYLTRRQKL